MHGLPKFSSKAKVIQVGNGENVSILFIILMIITIQGYMCDIYVAVSEIHDNVDLVLGVKNFVELEEISIREMPFKFLNKAVPILPACIEMIKPKDRRYVKGEAPFLDEICGLGIIKLLALGTYNTLSMKVKCERYKTFFEITMTLSNS